MEVWKDIGGYEKYYQVSNKGRVKKLEIKIKNELGRTRKYHERITKQRIRNGYLYVELSKNNIAKKYSVHRLVALGFVENKENKKFVNHINGVKTDNNYKNLEWVTHKENIIHSHRIGLRPKYHKGKKVVQIDSDGYILKEFESVAQAHRKTGICKSSIGRACRGEYRHAGGFHWNYTD